VALALSGCAHILEQRVIARLPCCMMNSAIFSGGCFSSGFDSTQPVSRTAKANPCAIDRNFMIFCLSGYQQKPRSAEYGRKDLPTGSPKGRKGISDLYGHWRSPPVQGLI
jgi:hypothetical protein